MLQHPCAGGVQIGQDTAIKRSLADPFGHVVAPNLERHNILPWQNLRRPAGLRTNRAQAKTNPDDKWHP